MKQPLRISMLVFAAALFLAPPGARAQDTLEDQMLRILSRVEDDKFITFNVENDMFGGGSDRNYTSGVRLTYFDIGAELPAYAYTLDDIVPVFRINKTSSVYYSIGQNLYTPKDIRRRAQDLQDRPWAAYLYASAGLTTITGDTIDEMEASLGVVGPPALGKPTQRFVHKLIDSDKPQGWNNQLRTEPALMLSWQRRWPGRYGFEVQGLSAGVEPHFGATLGNVYSYANGGLSLRLSPLRGRWQDDPIRVRPAMPGTGAFLLPQGVFTWHLFGGVEGRAIARNIFLDGNSFRDSYSVDKKPFVADLNAGIALTYGKTRLSYALVYRTKEFETQEESDIFGTISLGFRF